MVEVFKTDVTTGEDAKSLIEQIHKKFEHYQANFDLEDCDLILRVQYVNGSIQAHSIIGLLKNNGFYAEILPDEFQLSTATFAHFYFSNK